MVSLLLLAAVMLCAQWHIDEGFEGITTLPAGWQFVDDGDGMTWRILNNANYAHSGSKAVFVDNYLPNQNADWLITPQIPVVTGDSLVFYVRSWYGTENLQVRLSTTGTSTGNFNTQLANIQNISTTYQQVIIDLSSYAGQNVYVAFFWQCNTYGIVIDDVRIGQQLTVTPELNLPGMVSFIQGDELVLDFTGYVVCTDLQTASLSVAPTQHIDVSISGMQVTLSSDTYIGEEVLSFTLHDGSNGLTATDELTVVVQAPPMIDLTVHSIVSPRLTEYLNMPFSPAVKIRNNGEASFNDQIEVSYTLYDNNGNTINSNSMFYTADLDVNQIVEISFQDQITIAVEGSYSLSFTIENDDELPGNNSLTRFFNVVLRITAGGPDGFGYRFVDSNDPLGPEFSWIDISETGASTIMYNVPTWFGDDNFSEPIPLGFNFPFYGSSYATAYVDTNGEILLAPNTWHRPYPNTGWGTDGNMFNYMYPIPGYSQMPALIAVYWDDLHVDQGIGNVYFQTFGQAPDRYTIFQWHNVRFHAGTGGSPDLKFQVILHENGELLMQYHTVATGQTGSVVPHDYGASSTVAIQNQAANIGLCYLREIVQNNTYMGVEPAGNLLHDNLAIRFYSGDDNQAPVITHRALGNTFSQIVELQASIIDMSDLVNKSVFYNTGGAWQNVSASGSEGNVYYFDLTGLPLGSTVQYYFRAEDAEGNIGFLPQAAPDEFYSFKVLPTADTHFLIAYSGSQDYQRIELPVYEGLLSEIGVAYDIYNWEEYPEYVFPDQYAAIITYANTGSQSDKAFYLSSALMNYLELGSPAAPKNLWFASDGFASSQHAHPNSSSMKKFMTAYLRTSYIATGLGGGTNGLGGPNNLNYESGTIRCRTGSPVGTVNQEYDVYANSPDCIFRIEAAPDWYWDEVQYPEIGAQNIYTFAGGPFNGQAYLYNGVCATSIELPIYKAMYFSFDFSQLVNPEDRYEWMYDLISWWGLLPVSIEEENVPVPQTGLVNIYPNPFNPDTSINYYVAGSERINLAIYNLKGQKVKQLADDVHSAGSHRAIWDGKDDQGRSVSSGIYYLRFESPGKRENRKLTLIK